MKAKRKKSPQDPTLRNLRAMRKEIAKLYAHIEDLNFCLAINVESLNTRLIKLEEKRRQR